jgi:hypothetical protein
MLTDDKVRDDELDVHDNVNTRDQNRNMIVLFVLLGLFLAGLVGLGLSHSMPKPGDKAPETGAVSGNPVGAVNETDENFSVRHPVDTVELPGTIGKPQRWTVNGKGNTPATSTGTSTATGTDAGTATSTETSTAAEASKTEAAPAGTKPAPAAAGGH